MSAPVIVRSDQGAFFSLSPHAHFVYTELAAGKSLADVADAFAARFGARPTAEQLEDVSRRLETAMATGRRRADKRFLFRLRLLPQRVVRALAAPLVVLFTPALAAGALAAFVALVALDPFWTRLHAFAAPTFALAYALFFVSLLAHELGHAAATMRFGRAPAEIGFTMFVLIPAFYSDVTEIWSLPHRRRLVVDLAGIYAQLLVAAVLLAIDLAHPVPALPLAVTIIVLSCLYNLNPAFKSDGYWALSDLLDVHRLEHDAFARVRRLLRGQPNPARSRSGARATAGAIAFLAVSFAWWGSIMAMGVRGSVALARSAAGAHCAGLGACGSALAAHVRTQPGTTIAGLLLPVALGVAAGSVLRRRRGTKKAAS